MLELRKYLSGECRVVDTDRKLASEWLHHTERDAPLTDYDLPHDISDDESAGLEVGYAVIRATPRP